MSVAELSDPVAVEQAIEEFDRIGRDAFLGKYGFGRSQRYELVRDGRRYDVKAIVGAAYGYQFPEKGPLTNVEFTSGLNTTVPKLASLGFDVERKGRFEVATGRRRAFIFQANPKYYDIEAAIRSLDEMNWTVKQQQRQVRAGDRIYIWKSGSDRGVIAEGTVLTDPATMPEQEGRKFILDEKKFAGPQLRVRLSIDRVLDPPLTGDRLGRHPVLAGMRIFRIANNTNYRLSEDEDDALQELLDQDGGRRRTTLEERLEQWRVETGYPNPIDERRMSERAALAEGLSRQNLEAAIRDPERSWDLIHFDRLAHKAYGDPGNQSTINRQLKEEPETKRRVAQALYFLLYGSRGGSGPKGEVMRLNDVLTRPGVSVPGLSESLTTKALAVTRPDRWLPLYQHTGPMGKLEVMRAPELELEIPADIEQRPLAERIALTNDALRRRVEPLFPRDPWGQMVFLYWLRDQHRRAAEGDEAAEGEVRDAPEVIPYEEPELDEILKSVAAAGMAIDDRTVLRYHLSLRTRGFVILSGLSGAGKTWLAELYAEAVGARHLRVSVAPNWTGNEDLLGYLNAISGEFQPTELTEFVAEAAAEWHRAEEKGLSARPFHVTLDEMNLARVEYYFARFLSAIEVRQRDEEAQIELCPGEELALTPNLRFSGTVNVDETTHGFADKVLDRAQLIELKASREALAQMIGDAPYREDLLGVWDAVHEIAPFAFRVIDEIATYVDGSAELRKGWEEPLDEQLLQKVLPKIRGASPAIEPSLAALLEICDGRLPLTAAKARQMREHFEQHEFSSYF